MMGTLATPRQIRAIHSLKGKAGLDDEDTYRAALGRFGVGSSKDLSKDDAARFIDRLKEGARQSAKGALRLDGPYAGVCRALWLSAWNLGLVHDRTDRALNSFVTRQTGIESLNWVRDPREGAKAIEGLKAWIARDGGVTWPSEKEAKKAGISLARARKLAVIAAQTKLLSAEIYDPTPFHDAELDEQAQAFGRAIRAMKNESDHG
jgi:phage gp16-like protein